MAPVSLLALAPEDRNKKRNSPKETSSGADVVIDLNRSISHDFYFGGKFEFGLFNRSAEIGLSFRDYGQKWSLFSAFKYKDKVWEVKTPIGAVSVSEEGKIGSQLLSDEGVDIIKGGKIGISGGLKIELTNNAGIEIFSLSLEAYRRSVNLSEYVEIFNLLHESYSFTLPATKREELFNKAFSLLVYKAGTIGLKFGISINATPLLRLAGVPVPPGGKGKIEFGYTGWLKSKDSDFKLDLDKRGSNSSRTYLKSDTNGHPVFRELNYFRVFRGNEREIEVRLQDYNNVWMVGEKEYQRVVFSPWDKTKKHFQNYGSSALDLVNQVNHSLRQLYKGGGCYKNAKSKSGIFAIPGALGGVGLAVGSYEDAASRLRLAYDWLKSKGFSKEAKALLTSVVNPLTDFGIPELKEMNNKIPRDPQKQKSLAIQRAYLRAGDTLDVSSTFGPIDRITPLTQTLPGVAPTAKR